jgi:hypothetical protein
MQTTHPPTPPVIQPHEALVVTRIVDFVHKGTIRRGVTKKTMKKELTLRCLTGHHHKVTATKVAKMLSRGGTPYPGEFWSRVAELKEPSPHWTVHYALKGYNWADLYNRNPSATLDLSYLFIPDTTYGKIEGVPALEDPAALDKLKELKNRLKECVIVTNAGGQHVSLVAGMRHFIVWSNMDRQVHHWAPVEEIGEAKIDDLPRVKETMKKILQHQQEVKS